MKVGEKVVCVDDFFPTPLAKHFVNLPVKDKVYTIRAIYCGRKVMHPVNQGGANGEIGLLLQELINPPDLRHRGLNELGFNANRFRPLDTLPELSEAEGELVGMCEAKDVVLRER